MTEQLPGPIARSTAESAERYQGWANRETWAAALWLNNTPALYEASRRIGRLALEAAEEWAERMVTEHGMGPRDPESIRRAGASYLADMLDIPELAREYLTDPRDGTPEGMLSDIGSAWRIDYAELYDALTEEG